MLIRKSFRYRAYPSAAQVARLDRWDDALRFLWNLAHEQRRMGLFRPRDERRFPTAFDQINELTALRAELPWLADVPRNVCAQLLVELDKAWSRCFAKLGRAPRWKKKGRSRLSFIESHTKQWRLDGAVLRFPKLGNVRTVVHRPLEGRGKICSLTRDGDQWFVAIVCELEIADPAARHTPVVALDRGVTNLVGDSEGTLIPSPRFHKEALRKLSRAHRSLDRKQPGSRNRAKARQRLVRAHQKVRRQREHFLHTISSRYAKSHGVVVLERLTIFAMTKSASGTLEEPGRHVRQKSGLNRSIFDAGWGLLAGMLRYKLGWSGGLLIEVHAAYSSQTCNVCGHVDAASRVSQSIFRCTDCGHTEHADTNAAKVLKQRFETTRANRSSQPGEGSPPGSRRTRKRVALRVPRRAPESSGPRRG
jgi:putative transposase